MWLNLVYVAILHRRFIKLSLHMGVFFPPSWYPSGMVVKVYTFWPLVMLKNTKCWKHFKLSSLRQKHLQRTYSAYTFAYYNLFSYCTFQLAGWIVDFIFSFCAKKLFCSIKIVFNRTAAEEEWGSGKKIPD